MNGGNAAPKPRVLIVDDQPQMRETLEDGLSQCGFAVRAVSKGDDALVLLAAEPFDALLTDLRLGGMGGIELCERVNSSFPDVPVIVLTGFGSLDTAVAAMRAGAYDFITKPTELAVLEPALRRAIQLRTLREEVRRLEQAVAATHGFDEIIGESPEMARLFDLLARVADVDPSLLVTGETGTGKGLVARVIHKRGRRAGGPFVGVNCAALPAPLLESELFGHERGAFTDAKTRRTGLFTQAHGGTILLDEIGALPLELQPKLLRALEDRAVRPVGANTEIPFDARVISATNQDLEAEVEAGRFREDLFFRINVITVKLPPLRARGNDVLLLAQNFVQRFATRSAKRVVGLTSNAAEKLLAYAWPGNVRELHNCIERAVALTRYEQITVEDLPEKVQNYQPTKLVMDLDHPNELLSLEEVERRYVLRVLEAMGGNKAEAARVLGLHRRTLYRKLESWGMAPPSTPPET